MTSPQAAPAAGTGTGSAKPAPSPPPARILRDSPIIPLMLIGTGGYLLWFGVRYWRGAGEATWPSYPIKSVLQGHGLPENTPAPSAEAELEALEGTGSGGTTASITGYANPFARVKGLSAGRIDQGADFGGTGDVTAIGPGTVTYAATGDQTGWGPSGGGSAPGGFIRYRLEGGPAAGHQVYVAEGITPAVTAGQKISAGQVIGRMAGSIETGWASGAGTQPLSQTKAAGGIGGAGPFPTKIGQNFGLLLVALGVPAGPNLGQAGSGNLPAGYPDRWDITPATGGRPQNTARLLLASYGWQPGQMTPLVSLWNRESGWRPDARNPTSGALGIAQALRQQGDPAVNANTAGTLGNEYGAAYGLSEAQARAANSGSVLQQIRWGLGYIKNRYGSPAAAWAHEQQYGWY